MGDCRHILLIRHGLTDANAAAVIQGHQQTSLNETGLHQAQLLARRLGERGPKLDALVSSDLLRAMQTAGAIASAYKMQVAPSAQWRERCLGPWEGKTAKQFDIWRMAAGECDPPGAEMSADFRKRIHRALLAAAAQCPPNGNIAIVTHGGPCRVVLQLLADGELLMVREAVKPTVEKIANCSIMQLDATVGENGALLWRLVRSNDTCHLNAQRLPVADAG